MLSMAIRFLTPIDHASFTCIFEEAKLFIGDEQVPFLDLVIFIEFLHLVTVKHLFWI